MESRYTEGFVAGVILAIVVLWVIRRHFRAGRRLAVDPRAGQVAGVSTPGNPSGPAPLETHTLSQGI